MFINNFILEKICEKKKKERRIRTWDLQFTDISYLTRATRIVLSKWSSYILCL